MASAKRPLLADAQLEEPTPQQTPAWLVMFILGGVAFTGNAIISLIGPFLPQHFAEIGVSQIWSGVIFSGFPVAMLLSSPIAVALMRRFGRVYVLVAGLIFQGLSSFAFGLADSVTGGVGVDPQAALVVYVVSRLVCGFGGSLANNAIFSIAVDRFPDSLGRVMSFNEILIGVGFSVGPPIGTVLYLQGGFGFPFYAAGSAVLAFAPFALMLKQPASQVNVAAEPEPKGSIFDALSLALVVPAMSLFFATSIFGVVNSTLSLYLENEVGVTESGIGTMFMWLAVSYAMNGILVGGPVMDRFGALRVCTVGGLFGGLVLAVGFGLEGGIFPKGSDERKSYMIVILVLLGLAQAMVLVPSLPSMHAGHASGDHDSSGGTEAVVAWFNIFLQSGLAISPVVGTALVGAVGFERTTTICGAVIAAYGAFAACWALRRPVVKDHDSPTPSAARRPSISHSPVSPHARRSGAARLETQA